MKPYEKSPYVDWLVATLREIAPPDWQVRHVVLERGGVPVDIVVCTEVVETLREPWRITVIPDIGRIGARGKKLFAAHASVEIGDLLEARHMEDTEGQRDELIASEAVWLRRTLLGALHMVGAWDGPHEWHYVLTESVEYEIDNIERFPTASRAEAYAAGAREVSERYSGGVAIHVWPEGDAAGMDVGDREDFWRQVLAQVQRAERVSSSTGATTGEVVRGLESWLGGRGVTR